MARIVRTSTRLVNVARVSSASKMPFPSATSVFVVYSRSTIGIGCVPLGFEQSQSGPAFHELTAWQPESPLVQQAPLPNPCVVEPPVLSRQFPRVFARFFGRFADPDV